MADIVFPAASFAEKDGTFTSTERRVQRVRRAVAPPGAARADWEMLEALAVRLGRPLGFDQAPSIFAEMAALTPSYRGMSYARLERGGGLQWPCPEAGHPGTPVAIVYGARTPAARILRAALAAWRGRPDVILIECVEHDAGDWKGRVGAVVEFVEETVRAVGAERAALCGPAPMLSAVAARLERVGLAPEAIHVALERYMKCGTGLCGHCYVNDRYLCTDGPVFSLAELAALPEAF